MRKKILVFLSIGAMVVTTLVGCGAKNNDTNAMESIAEDIAQDFLSNEEVVNDIVSNMEMIVEEGEENITEQVQKLLSEEDALNEIAKNLNDDSFVRLDSDYDEYQGNMLEAYDIHEDFVLCKDGLAYGTRFYTFDTPIEEVIYYTGESFGSGFILCKLKDGTNGVFAIGNNRHCVLVEGVDTNGAICVNYYGGLRIIYDDYTCSRYKLFYHQDDNDGDEEDRLVAVTVDYTALERVPLTIENEFSEEDPDETLDAVRDDFQKIIFNRYNENYMPIQFNDGSIKIMDGSFSMEDGHNRTTGEKWSYICENGKYIEDLEFPVETIIANDAYQILYQTVGDNKKVIHKGHDRTLVVNLPENYTVSDIVFGIGYDDGVTIEFADKSIWTTRSVEDRIDTNTFDMEKEEFLSQLNDEGKMHGFASYNGEYFTFLYNGFMYTYMAY